LILFIVSGSFMLTSTSCIKDLLSIKEVKIEDSFNPELAIPLAHANISVLDMMKFVNQDSIAKIDPDGFIRFVYASYPQRVYANEIVNIPNQSFNAGPFKHNTGVNDSIRVNMPIYFFDKIDNNVYLPDGEELSKLHFKSGKMILKLRSTIRRAGEIEINITGAKLKNGKDFSQIIPISYTGGTETYIYDTFDLSGCKFDMTAGGTGYNKIQISYTITLNQNANYIRKKDEVEIDVFYRNIEFSYLEGYLGAHDLNYAADSIVINLLKNLEANNMRFYNPSLSFNFKNSAGMPFQISNQQVKSYATVNPVQLSGSFLLTPIDVYFPSLSETGQTKMTSSVANRYNSNIRDMLNEAPGYFTMDMDIKTNSAGKRYDNFLTDSSYFEIMTEINMPLYGSLKNYQYEFYLGVDSLDMSILEQIQLNLLSENGTPLDMNLQVYLADTARNILDSIVESTSLLFKSGVVDTSGKVIKPTKSLTKFIVSKDKIEKNPELSQFIIRIFASSADKATKDIKVYTYNRLDLKVSLYVKLKIEF